MKNDSKVIFEMLEESAGKLAQFIAESAFGFWERKDFRLYVNFNNISQTEQDRMFNELEVSVLGLYTLFLDNAEEQADKPEQVVFSTLRSELTPAFLKIMKDAGVKKEFLDIWNNLIDMRLKEYREDYKVAFKESSKEKEFKNKQELRYVWARIETITIDCLSHIRRGKVEANDPLWKLLRKWLTMLDSNLHPLIQLG